MPVRQVCTSEPFAQGRVRRHRRWPAGWLGLTLLELLLSIALLSILCAVLIPQLSGDLPQRLGAAAQIVVSDLDYARTLAVSNQSAYRITFEPFKNRYVLRHAGTNPQLNTLPRSPFRQNDDPPDQQTTWLDRLPFPPPQVRLVAVIQWQGSGQLASMVEFTSLGGTSSPYPASIWLACGQGPLTRYLEVRVDPVTGLASVGPLSAALPPAVASLVQPQAVQPQVVQPSPLPAG
jgi:type II secretory pathway pseudopilin PulG